MEQKETKQNQPKLENTKPNLLFAILAAIGLALIGCVLYGVLYYVGYIAWLVSYITILISAWGYKKFNKKMDWKGWLTVTVVSVAGLLITMFTTLTIALAKEYGCSFGVALKDFFTLLDTHTQLRNYVVRDGVLTAVFTLLGLLSYFFYEKRLQMAAKAPKAKINDDQKQNNADEKVEEPAKVVEEKKAEKTEEKPVSTKKKATQVKDEPTETPTPVEKKVTAVPADLKDKPARKPSQKKTQANSTQKPLVVKPVVTNKPKTTKTNSTKKTEKKG